MKEEIKEIYLSNPKWVKIQDDKGTVNGNFVFKNSISLKEFEKILENTYVILCDKDYITNLEQKINNQKEEIDRLVKQREKFMKKYDYLKEENEKLKKQIGILCDSLDRRNKQVEKAIEINKKLQNIGILDSRAVLWLSQQENILNGGVE